MPEITVLVTGGNRGIGLEICRQLAARGARVLLASRDPAKGEAARRTLTTGAAQVRVVPLAMDDVASIRALADQLTRDGAGLDVLINNAGVFDKSDAMAERVGLEVMERTLRTNLLGPLALIQALLPLLRRSKAGRIINLSSGMGQFATMGTGSVAYRISKTALNGLTSTLALELAGDKIAVNCLCPGWVKTDMGGAGALRELPEGADTPVWLALDAPQDLTGKFLRDRAEIPW